MPEQKQVEEIEKPKVDEPSKKEQKVEQPKVNKIKAEPLPIKKISEKARASRKVPEKKVKQVEKLAEDMKKAATVMIISIKGVPSPQFQKIKKDLRGKAVVKIVKKNILNRAIDKTGVAEMTELKEHVQADCAVGLSDEDAFELGAWLTEHRNPIAAKQGQIAEKDIDIEAGPTSLMPGPDISALGGVGLKVAVESGKIAIKASHTLVKAGEKVTPEVASVLQKLEIKPFMIGLNPAVIYDSKAKKIYVGVKIDKKQTIADLVEAKGKALGLAQNLGIITKETIGFLLAKANAEMEKLGSLIKIEEPKAEEAKPEPKPEEKAEAQPKPEEEKKEPLPEKAEEKPAEPKPAEEAK